MVVVMKKLVECDANDPAVSFQWSERGPDGTLVRPKKFVTVSEEYEGATLELREENGYSDSDFYALVWDEASQSVKRVEYATTRGWTYGNYATVDATPEVREKARAYYEALAYERLKAVYARESKTPKKGRVVRNLRCRKMPKGAEGVVFWEGADRFDGSPRVGVELQNGERFFVSANGVEVVSPEQYVPAEEEVRVRAKNVRGSYLMASPGYAVM